MELSRGSRGSFIIYYGIISRCKNTLHPVGCLPRIHFTPASRSNDKAGKLFLSKDILESFQKSSQFVTHCWRRRLAPSPSLVLPVTMCWHPTLLPSPRTSHILYISTPNILQKDIFGKLPETFPKGSQFVTHLWECDNVLARQLAPLSHTIHPGAPTSYIYPPPKHLWQTLPPPHNYIWSCLRTGFCASSLQHCVHWMLYALTHSLTAVTQSSVLCFFPWFQNLKK